MDTDLEDVEQAAWMGDDEGERQEFWPAHLRRQLQRAAVVVLILLGLIGLRGMGRPGHWLLDRIGKGTRVDMTDYLTGFLTRLDLRGIAQTARRWFASEWQVVGPELRQGGSPPALIWPVRGGRLLSPNNQRAAGETGLDLQVPAGSTVFVAWGGVVAEARRENDGTMTILVQHEEGWQTVYGRCQGLLVAIGEKVAAGQPIALVGTSPPPTPAHLHFELWDRAVPVDPTPYLGSVSAADGAL